METVNSLSGGGTSSFIAVNYPAKYNVFSLVCINDKECTPKDATVIHYVNDKLKKFTGQYGEFIATAEDDRTIVAMMDLEQLMGKEITWVRGKSFDDVLHKPGYKGKRTRLPGITQRYCTEEMKMWPIFEWWMHTIGEKVEMRIGFRFDEFSRMQDFMNNPHPNDFHYPISCSTRGLKQMKWNYINWRKCSFPLIRDGITDEYIKLWWKKNGFIKGSFFTEQHFIDFPVISNCVGCPFKKPETIAIQSNMNLNKLIWFSHQENTDMGTWFKSGITYEQIINSSKDWIPEMLKESGAACDSGGCHD